jgi:hypothetical protein
MQREVDHVLPVVQRSAEELPVGERALLRRILCGTRAQVFAEPDSQPVVLSLGSTLRVNQAG